MTDRVRPFGVSILALLAVIGAGLGLILALSILGGVATGDPGPVGFVVIVAITVLLVIEADGLWALAWWAWPLAVLAWTAASVQALLALGRGTLDTNLVVGPLVLLYLFQGHVRAAFGPRIVSLGRRGGIGIALGAAALASLLIGSMVAAAWTPGIPAEAGTTLVAQATLQGDVLPDPSEGTDPASVPTTPTGQACLESMAGSAGRLDLCWEAYRLTNDLDPGADYYRLRVYGTVGGEAGSGVRWTVVKARLGNPDGGQVVSSWPDGAYDGPCTVTPVTSSIFASGTVEQEQLCGRTTPTEEADGAQRVTWTCVGCLIADHADRSVALYEDVRVPEGAVPSWAIYADFGD